MKKIAFLIICFAFFSCKNNSQEKKEINNNCGDKSNEITNSIPITQDTIDLSEFDKKETNKIVTFDSIFDFTKFIIDKHRIGLIRIGMSIIEAEKQIKGLSKYEENPFSYGFGGEGVVYSYYLDDEIVFTFIPFGEPDSIKFILVFHENLKTFNGLSPKSTVNEIINEYPDLLIEYNDHSGGEYFYDEENLISFEFRTRDDNLIGDYPKDKFNAKVLPIRKDIKTSWIIIR
jgi:hypothetical protein